MVAAPLPESEPEPESAGAALARLAGQIARLEQIAGGWEEPHAGIRSEKGRDILRSVDFANVRSLTGGIDAWSRNIDPDIARY